MKRTIFVVGSATTSMAPDTARVNCGVRVMGPNAQAVLRRSNEAMHGVNFAVYGPAAHPSTLRRAAMEAAHMIATELAEAGGAAVVEIDEIDESSGHQAPVAVMAEARMARTTLVEAGEQQLRIDVDVTYRLVDHD